ncbi:hypothetical protein FRX31_012737 [Thalictrum thalictroides]|uniref:Uncharacterized protein n=1 Tax=Thalictrum thalictroides TaxID=46969 RepID=A0A7J6WL33_THATH|nr:hypothetical protein FRX31_012737 [Thalictrum thalictroides]
MLDRIAQTSNDGPVISFVSGIWIKQSLPSNPKFKTDAEDFYKLDKVENVDFEHKQLNPHDEKKTEGKLPTSNRQPDRQNTQQ